MPSLLSKMAQLAFAAGVATLSEAVPPTNCTSSTPGPDTKKNCTLKAPTDIEFPGVCHPGGFGHIGGAEKAQNRCGAVKAKDGGVFKCACCGTPIFFASTLFHPQGDGWPAFHGNATVKTDGVPNVCSPGGTEVVCATCGAHLGDHFAAGSVASYEYFCVDGVCMLPPGAKDGQVCQPSSPPPQAPMHRTLHSRPANVKPSVVV